MVAFHGVRRSFSLLIASAGARSFKGEGGQDRSAVSHTVYSRPVRCFPNSRRTSSSGRPHGSPLIPPWGGSPRCLRTTRGVQYMSSPGAMWATRTFSRGDDSSSAPLSFLLALQRTFPVGVNVAPPPRRQGNRCARCVGPSSPSPKNVRI